MTNSNDRLDRIETILEQFITASVADRQASNERMTRIEQSMTASDQRMTRIEEATDATDAKVGVLVIAIDTLAVEVRRVVCSTWKVRAAMGGVVIEVLSANI